MKLFRPTRLSLRRFIPPWEQEGSTAEKFFNGVIQSRNPIERQRRDTARYEAAAEKMEATAAFNQAEDSADRERAAATAALSDTDGDFLPYGSAPVKYFDRSKIAAWGTYAAGVAQQTVSNMPVPQGYGDNATKRLLLSDIDTPLPYKYDALPAVASGPAPYPWPLGGTMGVVLDMDGVIYRSNEVLEGSDTAVKMLQQLKIPFVFMTNGGGYTEAAKAQQLTKLLGLSTPIQPDQVIMSYSPMRHLAERHAHENVLVVGLGDSLSVAKHLGFTNAVGILSYQAQHPELVPFKFEWPAGTVPSAPNAVPHIPFGAIVVVNDSADAFNDFQVMLDVAISPFGCIGEQVSGMQTVPIYWQADDLLWAAQAKLPRLGGGAFREMFASTFLAVTGRELEVTCFGKPRAIAYAYAERMLEKEAARLGWDPKAMRTIAMVGDNLETDIIGANARGKKWLSVHVMTGIGGAPAACRTISPNDLELKWLSEFPHKAPHYIAPTLDHFVREALAFGEDTITMNRIKFYGKPSPVDLKDQYNF